jgi:hypothetical protein
LVVGTDGSIYLGGTTASTDLPTVAPLQPAYAGSTDGFIARIAPDTCALAAPTGLVTTPGPSPLRPTFSWQGVLGAEGYLAVMSPVAELVLTGSSSLQFLGVSANTSFVPPADLATGDFAWMVMAWSSSCGLGARSRSQPLTLLPGCPAAPALVSPIDVNVTSPVRFVWTPSAGASLYKLTLFYAFSGGFVSQYFSATNEFTVTPELVGGDYRWVVSAFNSSCGPATSAPGVFTR